MNSEGNQPDGKPLLFHPVVAQQQKIAVQSRKPADVEMQRLREPRLQSVLFLRVQMMMPHIGRIGEHQIEALRGWALPGEIAFDNVKPLPFP